MRPVRCKVSLEGESKMHLGHGLNAILIEGGWVWGVRCLGGGVE